MISFLDRVVTSGPLGTPSSLNHGRKANHTLTFHISIISLLIQQNCHKHITTTTTSLYICSYIYESSNLNSNGWGYAGFVRVLQGT